MHQRLPLAVRLHPPLVRPPHLLEATFFYYLHFFEVEAIFEATKDVETERQTVLPGFGAASGGLFGGGGKMSVDFAVEYKAFETNL